MSVNKQPVKAMRKSKSSGSLTKLSNDVVIEQKLPDSPMTPVTQKEDTEDAVVNDYKERLVLLHHACYCENTNAFPPKPCRLTPNCMDTLILLQHVTNCKSSTCTEIDCATTKFLRNHFQNCKVFKCSICTPLHKSIERKRQQEESLHVQQKKRRSSFDNTTGEYSTFRKLSGESNPDDLLRALGVSTGGFGRKVQSMPDLLQCYELEPGTFPPFFAKPFYIEPQKEAAVEVCSPLTISENESEASLVANPMIEENDVSPAEKSFYIPHPAHFSKSNSTNHLSSRIQNNPNFSSSPSTSVSLNKHIPMQVSEESQSNYFNAMVDFMDEVAEENFY